jgi:hypothetical protein
MLVECKVQPAVVLAVLLLQPAMSANSFAAASVCSKMLDHAVLLCCWRHFNNMPARRQQVL